MYGSSQLDGKLKIITVDENAYLSETHFVETPWGVSAAEFFQFENGDAPS